MSSLPKELIVDASILFSFFKKESVRRHLTKELMNKGCKLFSPPFILEELRSDKEKIIKSANISHGEFEVTFSVIEKEIELISEEEYEEFIAEADKISPHEKDVPYFALALSFNMPIWSDEKEFKEQSKIEIFSTKQLFDLVSSLKES